MVSGSRRWLPEDLTSQQYSEDEPTDAACVPQMADNLHRYRAAWNRVTMVSCWVRVFDEDVQTPVIVLSEARFLSSERFHTLHTS